MDQKKQLAEKFQSKFRDYQLEKLIGTGGMGDVWEAIQTNLDRQVAVKILARELVTDPKFVARFKQEARALAKLNHRNIVTIHDAVSSGEFCFIAMEYVVGPDNVPVDLKDAIEERSLNSTSSKKIICQVLEALEEAHHQSIVHRDIKPSNVMLDKGGDAKVADFGIASLPARENERELTQTSMAMGTSDYMAPEQRRDAKNVDHRADLYSCGVMLYEMLTGALPHGSFPKASSATNGLNKKWDAIIEKSLQPQAQNRFVSAADMLGAIAEIETFDIPIPEKTPVVTPTANNSTLSIPDNTCYSCRATVGGGEKFCPGCGISLKFDCPECKAVTYGGAKFCSDCGLDIYKTTKFNDYFEQATNCLTLAEDTSLNSDQRFEQAEQATVLIARARRFDSTKSAGVKLQKTAADLLEQLAYLAGQNAFESKKYAQAKHFLEVLGENPERFPNAEQRLAAIEKVYDAELTAAQSEWQSGELKKSIARLKRTLVYFENDTQIKQLLDQYQGLYQRTAKTTDQLKNLVAMRQLFEFKKVWSEAKADGLVLPPMSEATKKIDTVEKSLQSIESDFQNQDYESCISNANKILQVAVDCDQAKQLKEKSLSHLSRKKFVDRSKRQMRRLGLAAVAVAMVVMGWMFRDSILPVLGWNSGANRNVASSTTAPNSSTAPAKKSQNPPANSGSTPSANKPVASNAGAPNQSTPPPAIPSNRSNDPPANVQPANAQPNNTASKAQQATTAIASIKSNIAAGSLSSASTTLGKFQKDFPNHAELISLKKELADAQAAKEIEAAIAAKRFTDAQDMLNKQNNNQFTAGFNSKLEQELDRYRAEIDSKIDSGDFSGADELLNNAPQSSQFISLRTRNDNERNISGITKEVDAAIAIKDFALAKEKIDKIKDVDPNHRSLKKLSGELDSAVSANKKTYLTFKQLDQQGRSQPLDIAPNLSQYSFLIDGKSVPLRLDDFGNVFAYIKPGNRLIDVRNSDTATRSVGFFEFSKEQPVSLAINMRESLQEVAMQGHSHGVLWLVFDPTNPKIAFSSGHNNDENAVFQWSLDSFSQLQSWQDYIWNAYAGEIAVSADGKRIAYWGQIQQRGQAGIVICDVRTRETIRVVRPDEKFGAFRYAFSPVSSDALASARLREDQKGQIQIYYWPNIKNTNQPPSVVNSAARNQVLNFAFSPDGRTIFETAGNDRPAITKRDLQQTPARFISQYAGAKQKVARLHVNSDGKRLIAACCNESWRHNTQICIWDIERGDLLHSWDAGRVNCVAFSKDGNFAAMGDFNGWVQVVELQGKGESDSPIEIYKKQVHSRKVQSLAFSPTGGEILTGGEDSKVNYIRLPISNPKASSEPVKSKTKNESTTSFNQNPSKNEASRSTAQRNKSSLPQGNSTSRNSNASPTPTVSTSVTPRVTTDPIPTAGNSAAPGVSAGNDSAAKKSTIKDQSWRGDMFVNNKRIRLRFNLYSNKLGEVISEDEGNRKVPMTDLKLTNNNNKIFVAIDSLGAKYEGQYDHQKKVFVGTWTQQGKSYPLSIGRISK